MQRVTEMHTMPKIRLISALTARPVLVSVVAALDLKSGLAPELRREEIEQAIRALGDYMTSHSTLEAVRAAYHAGDFAAAFIHKDTRAILEAGEAH